MNELLGRPMRRCKYNIKTDLNEISSDGTFLPCALIWSQWYSSVPFRSAYGTLRTTYVYYCSWHAV